jgi:hypothetical protein
MRGVGIFYFDQLDCKRLYPFRTDVKGLVEVRQEIGAGQLT